MKPITVLLADDSKRLRVAFRNILESGVGIEVVGEARNGRIAVELAMKLRPAVVLMDITMPVLNGLEATRQICKAIPATKVIMLSAHSDYAYVGNAIEAGAVGYLLKQTSADQLRQAVRAAHKGQTFYSPAIAKSCDQLRLQPSDSTPESTTNPITLTPRQRQVLQHIAEGKNDGDIAANLGIGLKTVAKHRAALMKALSIRDAAGLNRYVLSARLSGKTLSTPGL